MKQSDHNCAWSGQAELIKSVIGCLERGVIAPPMDAAAHLIIHCGSFE
jgi:hypothetical protein